VAWFRFKDGVTTERIEETWVPVVRSLDEFLRFNLECGPNLSDRADGLTHCIIVSLRDYDALPELITPSTCQSPRRFWPTLQSCV
jgi:hypothetical protein